MIEVEDALGRRVLLPRTPRRIVSLVPSLTALLADLGLDEEVVGLTRFCVHPAGWKQRKRVVGGTKDLRPERVAELGADLVLANEEENVRAQVEALPAPVYVTRVRTLEDDLQMVRAVGALTSRAEQAEALARETAAAFAALPA
ncbi:MAG: helical backbone metal receptor [Planctomycetota bacterium]